MKHGFDYFYGLPFTLVDGFEHRDPPFLTYTKQVKQKTLKSPKIFLKL